MDAVELKSKLHEGNFIAFFGAGYSMRAGYPSWKDLLLLLSEKTSPALKSLVVEKLNEGKYLAAADLIKAYSEKKFYTDLCEVLRGITPSLNSVESVAYIPFVKVITTNYDRLYEKSVSLSRGESISSFSSGQSEVENFAAATEESILHLHGDVDRPLSLVIDSMSYDKMTQTEWYQTCIRTLFSSHPFLFIGFSFKDPAIQLFIDFCRKYLKFYLHHKSYMLGLKSGFSAEDLDKLRDANIDPILFETVEEIWKFVDSLKSDGDAIKLIRSRHQSLVPSLYFVKHKFGVAYAAAKLYLDGQAIDTQSRISAALILNHLMSTKPTSFSDLVEEIEEMFIISNVMATDLTERGIKLLLSLSKIDGSKEQGFILLDKSFDPSSFQAGIENFIKTTLALYSANYNKTFPVDSERLLEFLIEAIEFNCAALASTKGPQMELYNLSHLLDDFLYDSERPYKKEFERALRIGLKNISAESAGTLRNLALAASAFQLSFYNPQKVLGPVTADVDCFLLDANVLIPILAHSSPEQSFNKRILNQLNKYSKKCFVTHGALQEIRGHLQNALEEYTSCGGDDDTFTTGLYLSSKQDTNAFQTSFAVLRETERIKFTQYIDKYLGWRTEADLIKKLEGMGIGILSRNRKKEEMGRISSTLKSRLNQDSKKVRMPHLLEHDSEYLYVLESELRFGLLTYDYELSRAIKLSPEFINVHNRVISPVVLASFMDLESLPDIDCKAYIRKLLPTGKGSVEDVVHTHYLSKALMEGHKLSMNDIGKVMNVVASALVDAAKKSAIDIHSFEDLSVERATQILGYIEPRFLELAGKLDRN